MQKNKATVFIDASHVSMRLIKLEEELGRRIRLSYSLLHQDIARDFSVSSGSTVFRSKAPAGRSPFLSGRDMSEIRALQYEVVTLPLKSRDIECFGCGRAWQIFSEKTVDAAIITAMFRTAVQAGNDEEIILVSGDGDFLDCVQTINELGSKVTVYGFEDSTATPFVKLKAILFRPLDPFLVPADTSRYGRVTQ